MRRCAEAVAALVVVWAVVVAASALAAPGSGNGTGQACYQGAWQSLYRADGTVFQSQGDCVSYAAQGGAPTPPFLFISGPSPCTNATLPYTDCFFLSGVGLKPNSIASESVLTITFGSGSSFRVLNPTTDANGAFNSFAFVGTNACFGQVTGFLTYQSAQNTPITASVTYTNPTCAV